MQACAATMLRVSCASGFARPKLQAGGCWPNPTYRKHIASPSESNGRETPIKLLILLLLITAVCERRVSVKRDRPHGQHTHTQKLIPPGEAWARSSGLLEAPDGY